MRVVRRGSTHARRRNALRIGRLVLPLSPRLALLDRVDDLTPRLGRADLPADETLVRDVGCFMRRALAESGGTISFALCGAAATRVAGHLARSGRAHVTAAGDAPAATDA